MLTNPAFTVHLHCTAARCPLVGAPAGPLCGAKTQLVMFFFCLLCEGRRFFSGAFFSGSKGMGNNSSPYPDTENRRRPSSGWDRKCKWPGPRVSAWGVLDLFCSPGPGHERFGPKVHVSSLSRSSPPDFFLLPPINCTSVLV